MSENIKAIAAAAMKKIADTNATTSEAMSGLSEAMVLTALANGLTKEQFLEGITGSWDIVNDHLNKMISVLAGMEAEPTTTARH